LQLSLSTAGATFINAINEHTQHGKKHDIDTTQYLPDFHAFKIYSLVASSFDNLNF